MPSPGKPLPVASMNPLGLKASVQTGNGCRSATGGARLGGRVAEEDDAVAAGRGDPPAVGAEGHRLDRAVVLDRRGELAASADVPEPGRAVLPSREHAPTIGAEGRGEYAPS